MASNLSANAIIIIAVIIFIAVVIIIRILAKKAAHKTSDAIRNKMVEKQEKNYQPQQENLSDRYNNINSRK